MARQLRPPVWHSGRQARARSSGPSPRRRRVARALNTSCRHGSIAPLGRPVVPLVYRIRRRAVVDRRRRARRRGCGRAGPRRAGPRRSTGASAADPAGLLVVGDHQRRLAVGDPLGELGVGQAAVERDQRRARADAGEEQLEDLGPGAGHDRDPVAGRDRGGPSAARRLSRSARCRRRRPSTRRIARRGGHSSARIVRKYDRAPSRTQGVPGLLVAVDVDRRARADRGAGRDPVGRADVEEVLGRPAQVALPAADERVLGADPVLAADVVVDAGAQRVADIGVGRELVAVVGVDDAVLDPRAVDERGQLAAEQLEAEPGAQVVADDVLVLLRRRVGVDPEQLGRGLGLDHAAVVDQRRGRDLDVVLVGRQAGRVAADLLERGEVEPRERREGAADDQARGRAGRVGGVDGQPRLRSPGASSYWRSTPWPRL